MNIEYVHVFSPYSQHVAERVAEVLAGKQVDGEVEGGVDDHEELHRGRDEHEPGGRVVHPLVAAGEDALDVGSLVHGGHQPAHEAVGGNVKTKTLVTCLVSQSKYFY